jgi:hypothetical protein
MAMAAEVIDQEQPRFVRGGMPLAIGTSSEQKLAQTVTAGIEGPLTAVQVPVRCESGSLIVEIVSVDGAHPGTTVLGRGEMSAAELKEPADAFRTIKLQEPVKMREGQRFTIVLRNPGGTCGVARPAMGESYAGGDLFIDSRPGPKAWIPARDIDPFYDLVFRTVVDADAVTASCRAAFRAAKSTTCQCLDERNTQRCTILHPSMVLLRRVTWPRVQWTLMPLTALTGTLEVDDGLGKTLRFDAAAIKPGDSVTLEYTAGAQANRGELQTTVRGAAGVSGTMQTTLRR